MGTARVVASLCARARGGVGSALGIWPVGVLAWPLALTHAGDRLQFSSLGDCTIATCPRSSIGRAADS